MKYLLFSTDPREQLENRLGGFPPRRIVRVGGNHGEHIHEAGNATANAIVIFNMPGSSGISASS